MMRNKLIRDKIPQLLDETYSVRKEKDYHKQYKLLINKLIEEAKEVKSAGNNYRDVLEELADVYEVITSIAKHLGMTVEMIEEAADIKREERGGFTEYYVSNKQEIE